MKEEENKAIHTSRYQTLIMLGFGMSQIKPNHSRKFALKFDLLTDYTQMS